jgi:transposase-like protein
MNRNRVSNELRDEILYQIRDLAVPANTVAEDFGIKPTVIQKLLSNPIVTKQPSLAQKREIVHLFNSGQVSHTEIAERYNITTDNIAKWRA